MKIIKLNAIPSTNDYLKERYKSGKVFDDVLVWTENQTSGRGQLNKKWISKKHILDSIKFYGNCEYSNYLKKIIK